MSEVLRVVAREQLRDVQPWHMPTVEPSAPAVARPRIADLEAITDEARREGHEQGLAEGRAAARAELQRQLQQLRALCDALARPLAQVDAAVERQLAELAMLVARRVVQAELRLQPEHLLGVVRHAIAALPAATTHIEIAVHPASAALLRDGLDAMPDNGWRIAEDPQLQPGDCRITGADSRIDATVAARLATLVDAALDDPGGAAGAAAAPASARQQAPGDA